jgi:hypothetical protein
MARSEREEGRNDAAGSVSHRDGVKVRPPFAHSIQCTQLSQGSESEMNVARLHNLPALAGLLMGSSLTAALLKPTLSEDSTGHCVAIAYAGT